MSSNNTKSHSNSIYASLTSYIIFNKLRLEGVCDTEHPDFTCLLQCTFNSLKGTAQHFEDQKKQTCSPVRQRGCWVMTWLLGGCCKSYFCALKGLSCALPLGSEQLKAAERSHEHKCEMMRLRVQWCCYPIVSERPLMHPAVSWIDLCKC